MKYYIAENGQQVGPFEPNELLLHGLTVNSLVWCEGMTNWTSASQVPELMALLSGQTFNPGNVDTQLPPVPPMGQTPLPQVPPFGGTQQPPTQPTTTGTPYGPGTPNQPYAPPQYGPSTNQTNPQQIMPKTWLTESVIATVVCCMCCGASYFGLIPGAIAIFNAWGSKTCYTKGDINGANKKSASAKMWFYITLIVGVVFTLYTSYQLMSNPNLIQDIQNGNFGYLYHI